MKDLNTLNLKKKFTNHTTRHGAQVVIVHLIFLTLLFSPLGANTGTQTKKTAKTDPVKKQIRILSSSQSQISMEKTAYHDVEIIFDPYRIYADYVEYNFNTREILATGRITMISKETVISGEKLKFNLDTRKGQIFDTYGQLAPTTRYTTKQLNQEDNQTLTFKKLNLTTCAQCVPRWTISCAKGKIKKEKYIEMAHTVFKIKKIPVFYVPYIRYPIRKDGRATGLLFPKMGHSTLKGTFLLNSFFWAIKPNVDLTLHVDYYSRAGLGLAEELRYLLPTASGEIQFYYFKHRNFQNPDLPTEPLPAPPTDPGAAAILATSPGKPNPSDYFFKMKHLQKIDFFNIKNRIVIDVDRQSNADFLRMFSTDFDSVQRRTYRSTATLTTSIRNLTLSANVSQNETFDTRRNISSSTRYLPKLTMKLSHQKLPHIPGYFTITTSYASIRNVGKQYDENNEAEYLSDTDSRRLNISPAYTLPLLKSPWCNASVTLKSTFNHYPFSKNLEATEEDDPKVLDVPLDILYHSAEVELKGPAFSRVFRFHRGKMKHLIEPTFSFRYVTKVDDILRARTLRMDLSDFPSYSRVGFSLSTRLLYKKSKDQQSAKDFLTYTVSQYYYFDPALATRGGTIKLPLLDETGQPLLDEEEEPLYKKIYPQFSQLENTLVWKPMNNVSLNASLYYNYYLNQFTRLSVSAGYNPPKSVLTGGFRYNKYIHQYRGLDTDYNTHTIGGGAWSCSANTAASAGSSVVTATLQAELACPNESSQCSCRLGSPERTRRSRRSGGSRASLPAARRTSMQKAGAQRLAAQLGLAIVSPPTPAPGATVCRAMTTPVTSGTGAGFYVDATQDPLGRATTACTPT